MCIGFITIDTEDVGTSTEDLLGDWSPPPLRPVSTMPLLLEKNQSRPISVLGNILNISPVGSRPSTAELKALTYFPRLNASGTHTHFCHPPS